MSKVVFFGCFVIDQRCYIFPDVLTLGIRDLRIRSFETVGDFPFPCFTQECLTEVDSPGSQLTEEFQLEKVVLSSLHGP